MNRKCDRCDKRATHHSVEIIKGQKVEKHLCDEHAAEEGLAVKAVPTPINELLSNFVKMHSGAAAAAAEKDKESGKEVEGEPTCENCGVKYSDFRENSMLGCPQCYTVFESQLATLLERMHEGATHHVGKVPRRAGVSEQRQQKLRRLRKRLSEAVTTEDYELAAKLRDDIRQMEESH